MKRLLILNGNYTQIPAIKKAKKMGHYLITCDYLEDNPGHQYADEYYNISYADKEGVLELAKSLNIDGIVCFGTDAAATTVAYVAEKLGLEYNPYKSVEMVTNKEYFRAFLKENGFCVPKAKGYSSLEEALLDFHHFKKPVMVKPVDSSGSRGVSKVFSIDQLEEKVEEALSFSKVNRFIIEESINSKGYQIGGDGFSVNGKLVFRCFSNCHFPAFNTIPVNPFVPVAASWPSNHPEHIQVKVHEEIQRLLNLLDMKTGVYNFDIQVDENDNVYILDMGVRNGGNLIPNVINYATGIDLFEYTVKAALNEDCTNLSMVKPEGFWSSYAINSMKEGMFKGIEIDPDFAKDYIIEFDLLVNEGQWVHAFTGSNFKIGTMILRFPTMEEMFEKLENMDRYVRVTVA